MVNQKDMVETSPMETGVIDINGNQIRVNDKITYTLREHRHLGFVKWSPRKDDYVIWGKHGIIGNLDLMAEQNQVKIVW